MLFSNVRRHQAWKTPTTSVLDPQLSLASGAGEGESKFDDLEKRLEQAPLITAPTITLEGDANGAPHPAAADYARKFSGKYAHLW